MILAFALIMMSALAVAVFAVARARAALRASEETCRQLRALDRGQPATLDGNDVNAVVARAGVVLRGMLGGEIAVTLALGADIRRIRGGAGRVEEIVLGLAKNVGDAMPTGGRLTLTTTKHIRLEQDAEIGPAGEYVRLIVAGTSFGIPEAAQSKVFEPFFAAQDAGENAVRLAKVHAIVKEGGGQVHLQSTAGVGTTFTVDLPAESETPAAIDSAPSASPLVRGFAPVLIVEDEPRVRELMKLVLVRAGHDVVTAAGPHEALAALHRRLDINLLLIDVVMPEMNGYDLAVEARKIVPGARVVFLSGFAPDLGRQPATDGFLAKPFTAEALTEIVQQALAAR